MAAPDPTGPRPGSHQDGDMERSPGSESSRGGGTARALDRFTQALAEIGPIEPGELDLLIARFGPEGTEAMARELVRTRRLTARQAAALLRGEAEGPWIDDRRPAARNPTMDALRADLETCRHDPAGPEAAGPGTVAPPPPLPVAAAGPTRPAPLSGRVVGVAAAVLGFTVAAVVYDSRRVQTGELLVQAEASDVRVTIRQAGRLVVRPSEKRSFPLLPGDYEVEIVDPTPGRTVRTRRVVVRRHARAVVTFDRPGG